MRELDKLGMMESSRVVEKADCFTMLQILVEFGITRIFCGWQRLVQIDKLC